jgi:GDP-4-dehydro-6-deoxy-D-mannose reductase
MSKVALVTGSEGFIGYHLVRFLREKGWEVIGSHRGVKDEQFARVPGVEYVPCDLVNAMCVRRVIEDLSPTHVFHLAAQSLPTLSWEDPVETFQSNIMGSLYIFEAIRRLNRPPVIVSACSSAEYGHVPAASIPVTENQPLRPLHPYGISKVCLDLLGREYFLDYGIPAVNLRVFNTTGPGKINDAPSDFVRQLVRIKKGLQPAIVEVGNLDTERAFLDVSDTVRGFYAAALKGKRGESYNLCAAQTHRMHDVLRAALKISGVKAKVKPVPRLMRPSDEKIIFGSTEKIRKDTGWKPTRTIEQTLASMIEYWEHKS